jgi:hypothetical protein
MISCLLADQASNTSFGSPLELICIHSRSPRTMDSTTPPQYSRNDSCQSRSDRSDDGQSLAAQKRRRIKSHRKSRGGCLMCKTRKVKVSGCKQGDRGANVHVFYSHDSFSVVKRSRDAPTALRWATNVCMALHQRDNKPSYDYNRHSSVPLALLCEISGSFTRSSRLRILRFHSRRIALGRVRFPLLRSR